MKLRKEEARVLHELADARVAERNAAQFASEKVPAVLKIMNRHKRDQIETEDGLFVRAVNKVFEFPSALVDKENRLKAAKEKAKETSKYTETPTVRFLEK